MERMKNGIRWALMPILLALQSTAMAAHAVAQDAQLDVNINTDGGTAWYQQWWVWVLVGLFVVIIVVAITSRGRPAAKS